MSEMLMPLLDHFHPPLHGPRRWEGFHHAWAAFIAAKVDFARLDTYEIRVYQNVGAAELRAAVESAFATGSQVVKAARVKPSIRHFWLRRPDLDWR